jgi:hypothetical protein
MATPGSGTAAPGAMPPGGPAGGPPDPSMIPLLLTDAALYYAHNFAGVGIALNILAFLVFSGRIWTRSYPVFRMGLDDYFMIAAYVSPQSVAAEWSKDRILTRLTALRTHRLGPPLAHRPFCLWPRP